MLDKKEEIEKAYPEAYEWARLFHKLYEEYAPKFGYETKKETQEFNPSSPNGRLMAYVCHEVAEQIKEDLRSKDRDTLIKKISEQITKDKVEDIAFEFGKPERKGWNSALNSVKQIILEVYK